MAIEVTGGSLERADQTFLWLLRRNQVNEAALQAMHIGRRANDMLRLYLNVQIQSVPFWSRALPSDA